MFQLTTQSPLAAGPEGFPRRGGQAYLPGALLRDALLSAALAYAIQRDEAFAAEMRRMAQHAFKGSAAELAEAMVAALLERQPELEALAPPDVPIPKTVRRRVLVLDAGGGAVAEERELELELFEGRLAVSDLFQPELETWLAAAARSFHGGLAHSEAAALAPLASKEADSFYRGLTDRKRTGAFWPLRVGFWTPQPEGARFLAFAGLAAAESALARRFQAQPFPNRVVYDPKSRSTLGWAILEKEG